MSGFWLGLDVGAWVPVVAYAATIGVCTLVDWIRTKRRARQGQ